MAKRKNIFTRLFNAVKKQGFSLQGFTSFALAAPLMGVRRQLDSYEHWVYSAVNAISDEVSSIEFKLFRLKNGEMETVLEHDVLDLIHRVNPFDTKTSFTKLLQTYKELAGEAFIFLETGSDSPNAQPQEMWLLRPDLVTVVPDENGFVKGYLFNGGRDSVAFDIKEIIHYKYPNPIDIHRGYSPIRAGAVSVDTFKFASEWNRNFFFNSARPDAVVQMPDGMSEEQITRIKREWEAKHKGTDRTSRTAFLEEGVEYKAISMSQKDMDFLKQKEVTRNEILGIYRVPKSRVGVTDGVNRANAEAATFLFSSKTIKPKMQELVDIYNEFLLPLFGDDLIFTFVDPTPENRELTLKEYTAGHNRWLTTNEIRTAEGLEPVDNGDVIVPQEAGTQTLTGKPAITKLNLAKSKAMLKEDLMRRNKRMRLKEKIRSKLQYQLDMQNKKIKDSKNEPTTEDLKRVELMEQLAAAEIEKTHSNALLKELTKKNKRLAKDKEKAEQVAEEAVIEAKANNGNNEKT